MLGGKVWRADFGRGFLSFRVLCRWAPLARIRAGFADSGHLSCPVPVRAGLCDGGERVSAGGGGWFSPGRSMGEWPVMRIIDENTRVETEQIASSLFAPACNSSSRKPYRSRYYSPAPVSFPCDLVRPLRKIKLRE